MGESRLGGYGESAITDLFDWRDICNLGKVKGANCAI